MATVVSYEWGFADGSGSNEQNPTNIYEMAGTYKVVVLAIDSDGDPFVGTLTIRVYDYDYGSSYGLRTPIPSLSDKCYRLPVRPGDGYGPSEYKDSDNPGFDWIWPPTEVGTAIGYDEQKKEIAIAIDAKTQKIYRLNFPDTWRDRVDEYSEGKRIISEIHEKGYEAVKGEQIAIVHNESHVHTEAFAKDLKGAEGYDSEGFPVDMRMDMQMHKNNEEVYEKKDIRIPRDGDIVYREKLEARTLQNRIKMYHAPWLITELHHEYTTVDKASRPDLRQMTESTFQENLSSLPLFHVSRNFFPLRNRATGVDATGTNNSVITGPDGRNFSAVNFTAGNGISDTLVSDLSGDFTLTAWYKDMITLPVTLYTIGTLSITIQAGNVLRYDDGVNPIIDFNLDFNGVNWTHIVLTRTSLNVQAYENKVFLGSEELNSIENYGSTFRTLDVAEGSIFDTLVLPRTLTAEEVEYYYDNVLRGGGEVLPEF
jgi:PKD repeat protein